MLIDCGEAFISKYSAPVFSVDMLRNNKKNILKKSFLAYYILSVYAHNPQISVNIIHSLKSIKKFVKLIKRSYFGVNMKPRRFIQKRKPYYV